MNDHDYSPDIALQVLLERVRERDLLLALHIEAVINEGKDESVPERVGKRKIRTYRRTVPYTQVEALTVAMEVLEDCLLELPMMANSAYKDFQIAAVGVPIRISDDTQQIEVVQIAGSQKLLEVEQQTATQITGQLDRETLPLLTVSPDSLDELELRLDALKQLVDFRGTA